MAAAAGAAAAEGADVDVNGVCTTTTWSQHHVGPVADVLYPSTITFGEWSVWRTTVFVDDGGNRSERHPTAKLVRRR